MRALVIESAITKQLDDLPAKHFRQVVTKVFALLREPTPPDARRLQGYPFWRVTSGEYRIIYDFSDVQLRLILFGKRNDDEVYRSLQRKM